jgi:hypothetical protein
MTSCTQRKPIAHEGRLFLSVALVRFAALLFEFGAPIPIHGNCRASMEPLTGHAARSREFGYTINPNDVRLPARFADPPAAIAAYAAVAQ